MDSKSAIQLLTKVKATFDANEDYDGFICIELDYEDDTCTVRSLLNLITLQLGGPPNTRTVESFIRINYPDSCFSHEECYHIRKMWLSAMIHALEREYGIDDKLLFRVVDKFFHR